MIDGTLGCVYLLQITGRNVEQSLARSTGALEQLLLNGNH